MYLFLFLFMAVILFLCLYFAGQAPYESPVSGCALLAAPAPDHRGAAYTKISMYKSIGGSHADWCLKDFPLKDIVLVIGQLSNGVYTLAATGAAQVYLNGDLCPEGEKISLKEFDLIDICIPDRDKPWSFEFQRRN